MKANINLRLELLESKRQVDEPLKILIQVIERQQGDIVIVSECFINKRGHMIRISKIWQ